MKSPAEKSPEEQFEKAWKKWTERPTRQSPAEAAARIGTMIRERRPSPQPLWAYAAAAVLLVAIGVALHWSRLPDQPVPAQPAAVVRDAPQLGQGEVLMWLDKETPLYMTFQAPEGGAATKEGKL